MNLFKNKFSQNKFMLVKWESKCIINARKIFFYLYSLPQPSRPGSTTTYCPGLDSISYLPPELSWARQGSLVLVSQPWLPEWISQYDVWEQRENKNCHFQCTCESSVKKNTKNSSTMLLMQDRVLGETVRESINNKCRRAGIINILS